MRKLISKVGGNGGHKPGLCIYKYAFVFLKGLDFSQLKLGTPPPPQFNEL
jgi:hypothetical protein